MILLKSPTEFELMRHPGKIVGGAHRKVREAVRPGITTQELDQLVEDFIREQGGEPAFKGYRGFPASVCASVNEEVVHGIPGPRALQEGDIVGVDIGVKAGGFYSDAAQTIAVGAVSPEARALLDVTRGALLAGIEQAHVGNRMGDISHAVQKYVESRGFSVVRTLVGHGIGRSMHEDPQVPNFGKPKKGPELKVGMALAIEPMVNIGGHEVEVLDDAWTVVTADGSLSAHFEHTVAILENGPEILTNGAVPE
ncbi:MAG: methionine aminopeptidase [Gemmatimonadota bacterium]|nr:MAG: methionine aminopeptidase [Gemmatimonadota bacterium]